MVEEARSPAVDYCRVIHVETQKRWVGSDLRRSLGAVDISEEKMPTSLGQACPALHMQHVDNSHG